MLSTNRNWIFACLLLVIPQSGIAGNWAVHASDLRAKIALIQQLEGDIEKAIEQKNQQKSGDNTAVLQLIVDKHKELTKTVEEYNELRNHVRFEHPEQGDETERKYRSHQLRSLDEFEQAVGIYGKLDRVKLQLRRVYNWQEQKDRARQRGRDEKPTAQEQKADRIKLSVD